ncbi:MAG: MmgE/PrpD family protein [Mycobacterium sp.]|jgi:2-methylcitrate dehydratase PrpD
MTDLQDEPTKTRSLADFVSSVTLAGLPPDVVHGAKRALVDWLAAVLAGSVEPASAKLRDVIAAVASEPVATIIGSGQSTSGPFAALANGYSSHAMDFDDVFNPPETTIHLGSCVWPTVLAIAEMRPLSGAQALAGYVAGFEVGARVARAAGITHFESGWQVTGTAGHLASAAAGARALGLGGAATANAMGMAAAQASGIRESYGSDAKALQPARAAMNGVLNALMAERGMTARDTSIEGERGLLSVISRAPEPEILVESLGEVWSVLSNGHKLYPNASLLHPAIDAAIELTKDPRFAIDAVKSVEVRMLPFAASVTGLVHPAPGSEARFSAAHCVAFALHAGYLGLDSFSAAAVNDPEVARLRGLVTVRADDTVGKRGARISVTLNDGTVLDHEVLANRGTPENPLSDDDLNAKLRSIAVPRLGVHAANELLAECWDWDLVARASDVLRPFRHPD